MRTGINTNAFFRKIYFSVVYISINFQLEFQSNQVISLDSVASLMKKNPDRNKNKILRQKIMFFEIELYY